MEPTGDLGIDIFLSLLPLPWQDGRVSARGQPPFCWVLSTQKKGIQGSGISTLAS